MKKLTIIVLIILLVALTGTTVINGIKIGNLQIVGLKALKQNNDNLDTKVKEATKLASTDYQKKIDELNKQLKDLQDKKEEYLDLENVSTEQQINSANSLNQPYKLEYLYVTIGNHAKNNGIKIDLNFTRSSSGDEKYYNINFTATGTYVRIAEFIMNLEDDSSLGFKVEDFKMLPAQGDGNTLQATFTCKNIKVEDISSTITNTTTNDENTNGNTTTDGNTTTSGNTTENNTTSNTMTNNTAQ